MNKKNLILVLLFLATGYIANAQSGKISGKVLDEKKKAVESATVKLLRAKDSSAVKLSVTNKEGVFGFEQIDDGLYLVSVSAVGFTNTYSKVLDIGQQNPLANVEDIILTPDVRSLKAVTVTEQKMLIEQKIDRMVVNVDAMVTSAGLTALEVLERTPGVSVNPDGNVRLKGKDGVQVFIDGKPSNLSGPDLVNFLRTMQSSQLTQIELMTTPPAQFDAAGDAGIINLKIKKIKQQGYNGALTVGYGQGRLPRVNESGSINYRNNKVNIFANADHAYRKNFQDLDIQRRFIDGNTDKVISHFTQTSNVKQLSKVLSGRVGIDYTVSKKTTIGALVSAFSSTNEFNSNGHINIADADNRPQSVTNAYTINGEKWKNVTGNINFRHVIDSTGKQISWDLDALNYTGRNQQDVLNSYFNNAGDPAGRPDSLKGTLPRDINIYSMKADYSNPFKNGALLEAGFKISFVKAGNDARYDSILYGKPTLDTNRYNHFNYNENINAVYLNLRKPLGKKVQVQLGLRLENTNVKGRSRGYQRNLADEFIDYDSTFTRHYTQLFPTFYLQYAANQNNTFGLNYGRRIRRPNYGSLNPFLLFVDRYTFTQGNPNLQPQFSHNIELSHTFKNFLNTTLNYSRTTDIIQEIIEQDVDRNQTYFRQANMAKQVQFGAAVAVAIPFTKWWMGNFYLNVYNNKFSGIVGTDPVTLEATVLNVNTSQQFRFNKGWVIELAGIYTTKGLDGLFYLQPYGAMNVGVSKSFANNKFTLRLNGQDIWWTQRIKESSRFSNVDIAFQSVRDTRVLYLGLTYRFSKGKVANRKKVESGAKDEMDRVDIGR